MSDEELDENEADDGLPTPQAFCLSVPLYKKFEFDKDASNPFFGIEHYKGTLDCYCEGCGRHSVFHRMDKTDYREHHHGKNYLFNLSFGCSRDFSHQLVFIFRSHQGVLEKIGQYPSMADLDTPDLQKYRALLGKDRYRELTRGVGLASHGVGAGAFVYLRRVFESLIDDAKGDASQQANWDEEVFRNARMDEKIRLLRDGLPTFLVENRNIYSIMSVGVHTLSDEECLDAFPVVKIGIELILDEMLERKERQKKVAQANKSIASLAATLKKI
ncbi:short-chain dehydrogenase [Burkholderia sp. Bp9143]|uniref:short-chain dehydrogenase n=1 Tax=Burkholderia sp. Bp9143 TaxID=2184574 RepID=UPI000F5AA8AF|nr:short-chain dehydrogenase [Burkholderia sp. Bp9143]